MSADSFIQISKERYDIVMARYKKYIAALDDVNKDVVTVFDPLVPKQLQELMLIREVSKDLQMKKEEFMKKAEESRIEQENAAADKTAQTEEAKKED